jgi:2-polyprenyl-6-methoxyphenol hydroxylase-like FAD-dependent oxidoreductase
MFRTPYPPAADPIGLVEAAYAGLGWRVPEILARAREELWCDSVSRVRLPRWSQGRVALVGDAASCVSLFGEGSSLAIAGAATLAAALAAHPVPEALRAYEHAHRRRTTPRQRAIGPVSRLLIPATAPGIAVRNAAMRLLPAA